MAGEHRRGFFFMTDEGLDRRRPGRSPSAARWRAVPAYRFACAAMLPASWIGSSIAGAALGGFLGDPKRFGADFAFTALLIGLVAGFNKGRTTAATVEPQIADEGRSSLAEEWTRRASSWDA